MAAAEQRDAIADAIRQRLAPVCTDWPADLFESVVNRLADITMKYQGLSSSNVYDRRSTDRLIDDLREALDRSKGLRGE
jgi:hypothetical protein